MINTLQTNTGVILTMDIKVIFKTEADKAKFAEKWALAVPEGSNGKELLVSWNLLQHVKTFDGVEEFSQASVEPQEHEFIINGELSAFESLAEVISDLGDGWYHVKSTQGIDLAKVVNSIEANDIPVTFLGNVISLSSNDAETTNLDPTSADTQWHRIRTISRYRPLLPKYALHELTYSSKPELYIMDSGINFDHDEFNHSGIEIEDFYTLDVFDSYYRDDFGHGTAVASMAAGKNLGIASHVKLINVKIAGILDGEKRTPSLLDLGNAIDAILERAVADPTKTRIVNMSWVVTQSSWLDTKIRNLLSAGVTVVSAAGNMEISVDDLSPAGIPEVITVGSIDKYDIPSGFNNIAPSDSGLTTSYGLSLDLFAPGENIMVADKSSGYKIASGTSLSAPLVAGIASEIAALNSSPILEPSLKNIIIDIATEDALLFEDDKFSDNQNRLAYFLAGDPAIEYKETDSVSYLGIHENGAPIEADLNIAFNIKDFEIPYPEDTITYSIELAEDSAEYSSFISCDPVTGVVEILPSEGIVFAEGENLKMVKFIGIAQNEKVRMTTGTIFFFDVNPDYEGDIEADITLALTDVNSVGFFLSTGFDLK